jgi:hypothetical protein
MKMRAIELTEPAREREREYFRIRNIERNAELLSLQLSLYKKK